MESKPSSFKALAAFALLAVATVVVLGSALWSRGYPTFEKACFNWRAVPAEAQVDEFGIRENESSYRNRGPRRLHFVRYTFQAPDPKTQVLSRYRNEQVITRSVFRDLQAGQKTLAIKYLPDNPMRSDLTYNAATETSSFLVVPIFLAPFAFALLFGLLYRRYLKTLSPEDRRAVEGPYA